MSFSRSARGIACLVAAGLAGTAAGQDAPKSSVVRETAGATVIEIPVNVIGKDGRPVAGLTAADFELYDDGKKQPIFGVEAVNLNLPAASPEATPAQLRAMAEPAARRHWLIVFDLSYTSLTGLLRARDGALVFVNRAMRDSDLAGVATLSTERGWKLLANFSADKKQLSEAIRTLGLPGLTARSNDPLGLLYTAPVGGTTATGGAGSSKGELMVEDMKELQQTLQRPATDSLARSKATELMKSLAGMGHMLDAVRGRKHILFFSEGFETRLLSGNAGPGTGTGSAFQSAPTNEAANAAVSGELWKVDSDARYGSGGTQSVLKLALAQFKRSDTVVDTIDISGLRALGDASNASRPGSGTDTLSTIATETDGDFIRNANQLGGEIEKLVDRTSLVYVLAYQPAQLSKPGAFHTLRVKVKTSGAKVLARSGYYEPRAYASLSPMERVLASGDLITSGAKENSLSTRLLAAPFGGDGKLAQVPIVLEIEGESLLAGETRPQAGVQIFAYAIDSAGTLADYLSQEMTLDLARVRSRLESGGVKFFGAFFLSPGDYTIRSLVRNSGTGRMAVNTATVRVPAIPGGSAVVLPPFFLDTSGKWLFVKASPRADAPAKGDYPFSVGGDPFIPATLPVVAARADGAPVQVTVMTFNFTESSKPEPLQVAPEILGADGKPRAIEIQVVKRADGERAGGRTLTLAFKPEGLTPGHYALRVRVSDRASRRSSEASSDFEVR